MTLLSFLPDVVFLLVVIVTAVVLSRKLVVEGAMLFLVTLISSVATIILFEPFGDWVRRTMFAPSDWVVIQYLWIVFALVIFAFLFILLAALFFRIVEQPPHLGERIESIGGWGLGLLTGYTLAAFLLTCMHAVPAPRDYWGIFSADADHRPGPILAFAPDYQLIWIAEFASKPLTAEKPAAKRKFTPTARLLNRERLNWFPVRFAVWRERLEWFKYAGDEDEDVVESPDLTRVADRASAPSAATATADHAEGGDEAEDYVDDEDYVNEAED